MQPPRPDILDRGVDLLGQQRESRRSRLRRNRGSTPSVASNAWYCLIRLASGLGQDAPEVAAVERLQFDPDRQSPCNSGKRSEGLAWWKAPEAMNRMWSVLTAPCLVATVVPSISGKRSRCTPRG